LFRLKYDFNDFKSLTTNKAGNKKERKKEEIKKERKKEANF